MPWRLAACAHEQDRHRHRRESRSGICARRGSRTAARPGDLVYLTGREPDRVRAAAARIAGPRAHVRGEVLDVGDGAAVAAFADALVARHGGVDIVFSNAAARLTPATPWAELVGPFVETNNLGTTRMLRAFDPILRPGGRLLVVASDFGSLRRLPAPLHERFDTDALSLDDARRHDAGLARRRRGRPRRRGGLAGVDQHPIEGGPGRRGARAGARAARRSRTGRDPRRRALPRIDRHRRVAALVRGHESRRRRPPRPRSPRCTSRSTCAPVPSFYGELVQFGQVIPWR